MKDTLIKIVKNAFPSDTIDIGNYSCDKTIDISHLSFYKSWELCVALSPYKYKIALVDRRGKRLLPSLKDWHEWSDVYTAWLNPNQFNIVQLGLDDWILLWNTTTINDLVDILFIKVPEKPLIIGLLSYKKCIQHEIADRILNNIDFGNLDIRKN